MRNFNSRDGVFKPIPGIKITPEGIPIQNEGYKNVQSRVKDTLRYRYRLRSRYRKFYFTKQNSVTGTQSVTVTKCILLFTLQPRSRRCRTFESMGNLHSRCRDAKNAELCEIHARDGALKASPDHLLKSIL